MKKLLIVLMKLVDFFYPKRRDLVIVGSSNGRGITGNSKIFGEYLEKKGFKVYYNWNNPPAGKKNISHSNIKNWPIFFSSGITITTHSVSDLGRFQMILGNRKRDFIELWHGIPIKSMGQLEHNIKDKSFEIEMKRLKKVTIWAVTSEPFKKIYREMFPLEENVFKVLGSPRNDQYMNQNIDFTNILDNLPDYDKVILYAPTRRENGLNAIFFPFKDSEISEIIEFIEHNKIIILLRGHIDDNTRTRYTSTYIRELNSDIIFDVDTVISGFDSIITDYSSIFFDFLFFNRPIGFIPYDLKEYTEERGLLFEYYSITPGEKIFTAQDFIIFLRNIITGEDLFKEEREKVFNMAYKYKDYKSCERIYDYLISNKKLKEVK